MFFDTSHFLARFLLYICYENTCQRRITINQIKECIMDEFRIEDLLDENLIFMNEEAPDYETLLHNLSDKLEEKGYVKCNRKRLCIRTTCTCCYIKRACCVQRNG